MAKLSKEEKSLLLNKDINLLTKEEAIERLKIQTKKANTRLVAIEEKNVTKSSNAYQYIRRTYFDQSAKATKKKIGGSVGTTKTGGLKFSTSYSKLTRQQAEARLKQIEEFLEARTSSASETLKMYRKEYDTYQANHPDSTMSYDEWADFWKSGLVQKYKSLYGSDEVSGLGETYGDKGIDVIESVLQSVGLDEATEEDKPAMSDIWHKLNAIAWEDIDDINEESDF